MVLATSPRRRTVATVALLAVVILGLSGAVSASGANRSGQPGLPAASPHPPSSFGLTQLAAARSSLTQPHQDRALHPNSAAVEASPGGYAWSNLSAVIPGGPGARIGGAMAWDSADGYVLLYGGENLLNVKLSDTWSYVNGTWTNLTGLVIGVPPPLLLTDMAYDPSTHSVIIFGGESTSTTVSAWTWSYHNRTWTNLTSTAGTPPSPRVVEALTTDSTDGQVVLFGGSPNGGSNWLADTWTFKAGHWTNVTATAGSAFGHPLLPVGSDDPPDHGVLVRAIYAAGTTVASATLIYSVGSWRNVSAALTEQPPKFYIGASGYLAPISAIVSTSGVVFNSTGSEVIESLTSEYSAGAWTNVTAVTGGPPILNVFSSGSVVGNNQSFLAFGVYPSGPTSYSSSTWLLSAPPKVSATANHLVVDPGTSVSFAGAVSEGAAPFVYHWDFGDGSTAAALSGAHAYAHPGTYAANLTITDLVGHSVTSSVSIVVNPPLSLAASATPTPAMANATVALTSALSGGTGPYTYHWSLGDGSTSTVGSLGHVYARAGNYTVVANVTDALGASASSTFTLEVNAAPHTPSSSGSPGSSTVSLTSGTGLYLLLGIVLLAIVVVALAALLARRSKSPPGPPAQYQQYQSGPGAPPPGAGPGGAPAPNWSEGPPQPPR